ncbi:MAG: ABC transporter substrate-binding protein, partial [Candidatus Uhrbacteria bacterium]
RIRQRFANLKSKLGRRETDFTAAHILGLRKEHAWPSYKQWQQLPRILGTAERKTIYACLTLAVLSLIFLTSWFVITHRIETPASGGEYTEGLVGEPQFVNPLYSSANDVDSDLVRLVFSGLFKYDPVLGLVPDLAASFEISDDHTNYTVTIREDAFWHDGQPVRASDVVFTIQSIQNPEYNSPLAVSFQGIQVSEISEKVVQFTLLEPFAPFLSTLTVGIIPSHQWEQVAAKRAMLTDLNLAPVGSGPYKFEKYTKDKNGNIGSYTLIHNLDYYAQVPYLERLHFKFYADANSAVDALKNRNIEGLAYIPADLTTEVEKLRYVEIMRPSIPQVTAVFFNQDKNELLQEDEVRQALIMAIDKGEILRQALNGFGTPIDAPILSGMLGFHQAIDRISYDPEAAQELINKHREEDEEGNLQEINFTMTVLDQPDFIRTAEVIKEQWAVIGVNLEIRVISAFELSTQVLTDRNYEMFLTGELLGIDPDPYPFWHSSQATDPGLNLANYVNRQADTLLEEARSISDPGEREAKYIQFQDYLAEDLPAIFLYQPTYRYAVASKINNVEMERITSPADRFSRINEWYTKTKMKLQWKVDRPEEMIIEEPESETETKTEVMVEEMIILGPIKPEVEVEEGEEEVDSSDG